MLPVAVLALAAGLAGLSAQNENGCWATDYAPDSITIRAAPSTKANSVRSVSKAKASSFVRVDGLGEQSRDWLKVQIDGSEGWVPVRYVVCRLSPEAAQNALERETAEVMQALKKKDFPALATYVHPTKGLRLSPYATVDRKVNVVVTASELSALARNPTRRTWGVDDGSGAPISLTFSKYYSKFIYDMDFAGAPKITYNDTTEGTAKAWEEFPSAIVVNYEFPEHGKNPEDHLRLTFEQQQSKWYLTAIIHDGWTI